MGGVKRLLRWQIVAVVVEDKADVAAFVGCVRSSFRGRRLREICHAARVAQVQTAGGGCGVASAGRCAFERYYATRTRITHARVGARKQRRLLMRRRPQLLPPLLQRRRLRAAAVRRRQREVAAAHRRTRVGYADASRNTARVEFAFVCASLFVCA